MKQPSQYTNSKYKVCRYDSSQKKLWDGFVNESKNATFLFNRNFMEYHKDRFEDFSLMVFKDDVLVAVLPSNKVDNEIHSHQGLSYGGLVLNKSARLEHVLEIFKQLLRFLNDSNIEAMHLKLLPKIYNSLPSDEIDYLLFLLNAKIEKREGLSVIELPAKLKFSKDRIAGVKRGLKHKLKIKEEQNFDLFWNQILSPNLIRRYGVSPVHTLEEIEQLKTKFPKNIRQFNVYYNDEIVAGTTIFETTQVAHCQYISAKEDRNKTGSLDFLHNYLIKEVFYNKAFYDFGSSTENNGKEFNRGLQYWKEGFGSRTVIQEFYSINTSDFYVLNNVIK